MAADLVPIDSIRQAHCSTHSARATGDGQPLHVISAPGRRLRLCSTSSWHGSIPWARSRPLSQPTKGFQHGSELDAQWSCSSSRLGHVVELHEQSKQYGTVRRHGLWPPVEQQSARFAIYVKRIRSTSKDCLFKTPMCILQRVSSSLLYKQSPISWQLSSAELRRKPL